VDSWNDRNDARGGAAWSVMVCSVMASPFGSVANIDRFTMLIPAGTRIT